jgi:hypothetical protein
MVKRRRMTYPRRIYRARENAMIRTIERRIEKVFELPQGCIRICHPIGRRVKGTSKIEMLRRTYLQ